MTSDFEMEVSSTRDEDFCSSEAIPPPEPPPTDVCVIGGFCGPVPGAPELVVVVLVELAEKNCSLRLDDGLE